MRSFLWVVISQFLQVPEIQGILWYTAGVFQESTRKHRLVENRRCTGKAEGLQRKRRRRQVGRHSKSRACRTALGQDAFGNGKQFLVSEDNTFGFWILDCGIVIWRQERRCFYFYLRHDLSQGCSKKLYIFTYWPGLGGTDSKVLWVLMEERTKEKVL